MHIPDENRPTTFFKKFLLFILIPFIIQCSSNSTEKSDVQKKSELYYSHGTHYLLQKNYTEALSHLMKADELTPNDSKIKNNLAMAYYFKEQTIKAIDLLNTSLNLDPKNSDARVNLASIYFNLGKNEKAFLEYSKVLEDLIYPHQYRTHFNIALIYLKSARIQEAINHLNLSLKENKDYCPSHYQLGIISKQKKDLKGAKKHFEESTKATCYNLVEAHYQLTQTYLDLKLLDKAKAKLLEIIEKFSGSPYEHWAKKTLRVLKVSDFKEETLPNTDNIEWEIQKAKLRKDSLNKDNQENNIMVQGPDF
jgi:type IV pilus assembly protein PilF